jgi:aromatic ring-opening dioxygenase catalytic subunit (LigB family)
MCPSRVRPAGNNIWDHGEMTMPSRWPTLFIPHGGGPCFFMDVPPPLPRDLWDNMAAYLRGIAPSLAQRPKAVLIISGHWETEVPTVNAAQEHSLYFDYYGFPEHTYRLTYPAKGSPDLAARVRDLLGQAGINSATETGRGLDHGVFVPLKLVYPDADIPLVQLSLRHDLDAAAHLQIGRALQPLRDEGVLIVGSGMSYHNMRNIRVPGRGDAESSRFDAWLTDAVTDPDARTRHEKLSAWRTAPCAIECHPEAEHLLPLHVAIGAAGDDIGRRVFGDRILGKEISAYQFG